MGSRNVKEINIAALTGPQRKNGQGRKEGEKVKPCCTKNFHIDKAKIPGIQLSTAAGADGAVDNKLSILAGADDLGIRLTAKAVVATRLLLSLKASDLS